MGARPPAPAPPPPPPGAPALKSAVGGGAGGASVSMGSYTRTAFETTPLFVASQVATVGEDGVAKAKVPFKLPDNIGTFVVRAFAVTAGSGSRWGQAESEVVVRRVVSLMPAVPRIVRTGDYFDAGVTITLTDPAFKGSVQVTATVLPAGEDGSAPTLALERQAAGESGVRKTLTLTGVGPHRADFRFSTAATALGVTKVRFSAAVVGMESALASDALESAIPTLAVQNAVTVATSMALQGSPAGTLWREGLMLPEALSGSLELSAATGSLATVLPIGVGLLGRAAPDAAAKAKAAATGRSLGVPSGADLASAVAGLSALADYGLDASKVGGSGAALAARVSELLKTMAAYTDAKSISYKTSKNNLYISGWDWSSWRNCKDSTGAKLKSSSWNAKTGLQWRPSSWTPSSADVQLNAWALHAADQLNRALSRSKGAAALVGPDQLAELQRLSARWRLAVEQGLTFQVLQAREYDSQYFAGESLALARMALGPAWQPCKVAGSKANDLWKDVSVTRLVCQHVEDKLSITGRAALALTFLLHPGKKVPAAEIASAGCGLSAADLEPQAVVSSVAASLTSQMRVQGQTAYIAARAGSAHSAGLDANALTLTALTMQSAPGVGSAAASAAAAQQLVAKLALYVAQGSRSGYSSGQQAARRALALSAHDVATDNAKPDLRLAVELTGTKAAALKPLLDAKFTTAADVANAVVPWTTVQQGTALAFRATGSGQAAIGVGLEFVPAKVVRSAQYKGVLVQKVIRRTNAAGEAEGPPVTFAQAGDRVRVTIEVTTPDDLPRLVVEDWVPGGLEPLDPNVAAMAKAAGNDDDLVCSPAWRWGWGWCRQPFPFRETRPERVRWSSGWLRAGSYELSYLAVAATSGVFALPPAQAHVPSQPEVMGLSAGGAFAVSSGAAVKLLTLDKVKTHFAGEGVAPAALAQLAPKTWQPKACDTDCGQGSCDLSRGECLQPSTDLRVHMNADGSVKGRAPAPAPAIGVGAACGMKSGKCPIAKCVPPQDGCVAAIELVGTADGSCCPKLCHFVDGDGRPCGPKDDEDEPPTKLSVAPTGAAASLHTSANSAAVTATAFTATVLAMAVGCW